ncbi:MAG: site-specific integrase [Phycisphaerales bacterium]|nr:site-specific integrase [Phycisphaerales bacterium]
MTSLQSLQSPVAPQVIRKRGRPSKPYRTTWGEEVHGLYRSTVRSNQWRVIATGERFTAHDEKVAVHIFHQKMKDHQATVAIPVGTMTDEGWEDRMPAPQELNTDLAGSLGSSINPDGSTTLTQQISEAKIWAWVREQLINRPEYVAKMTGIPEIARLRYLPLPKPPITLEELFTAYTQKNGSTRETKETARRVWGRFVKFMDARTTNDLTTEKLQLFAAHTEKTIDAPATRKFYYSKIKSVIAFGLKCGMDAEQIRATLDRTKVLWTSGHIPAPQPKPISKKDFHALLEFANTPPWNVWRGWLLVGLNLCLHIGEVCELKWAEFDLNKGTYVAIRGKTKAHRIPRAATLWPETVQVLKELKANTIGQSPYLFNSNRGTRYTRVARVDSFKDFKDAAGIPYVTFDSIRDASYTAACQLCPDERWARLLAGHRSPGLQDSYVLRSLHIVKPACDAVYAAFGPFPKTKTK